MHNNYFFLRQLAEELNKRITGFTVNACFSQNKDELIIGLMRDPQEFWIRADQDSRFSCLSFPEDFKRARKNSIDLFPELRGREVRSVYAYEHERAFAIMLDNHYLLLFKLFGNLSNILLFRKGECIDVFKHGKGDERKIVPDSLDRNPGPLTDEDLSLRVIKKKYPSLDQNVMAYLMKNGWTDQLSSTQKRKLLEGTLALLSHPLFYVSDDDSGVSLTLLPTAGPSRQFSNPVGAINYFYTQHRKKEGLAREKEVLFRKLRQQLKKTENYIRKSAGKMDALKKAGSYRQIGDIIMANLQNLETGMDKAVVFDFYNDRELNVRLNPQLSPQKNAEQYYRKAKNQKIEINTLERNIEARKAEARNTRDLMNRLLQIDDPKDLILFQRQSCLGISRLKKDTPPPRFKEYEHMGFRILVGRNARNNDELTFQYGFKEDLWLHAKDVKGSHVLVKYQAGKPFPKPVITVAAQLAAYYSGNRNMHTCAVIHTPRKYVRKSKGMPAGAVLVERESIIMVRPEDPYTKPQ